MKLKDLLDKFEKGKKAKKEVVFSKKEVEEVYEYLEELDDFRKESNEKARFYNRILYANEGIGDGLEDLADILRNIDDYSEEEFNEDKETIASKVCDAIYEISYEECVDIFGSGSNEDEENDDSEEDDEDDE